MNTDIICPKCEVFNKAKDDSCWKCNRVITDKEKALANRSDFEIEQNNNLPLEERNRILLDNAKKSGNWLSVPQKLLETESKKIKVTTSYFIANATIAEEIDIITAEVVYGMNIFKDIFASVRDLVGGRSESVQNILKDSRKTVLLELRKEALSIGADAVISVDLDYQELSGGGKNGMIMLVASGTAVLLDK
jgi:uncharacterized protein YbjQ (UPF0145 family)